MPEPKQDIVLSDSERARLQALWAKAAEPINPQPAQSAAQALAFGVNFRINLVEALRAAWETSKVVVKATAAAHVPFVWTAWLEVAAEAVGAAQAIFSSLVQRMRPIDYITGVILSAHPEGLTEKALQQAVEGFLNDKNASEFAWHFGMNPARVKRAKEVLAAPDWFADVLKQLRKDEFLEQQGDILKFKSRNYEVGWKAS
jgi:hypothetical protein